MSEKKKRLDYIDIARGIAIISIILCHLKSDSLNRVLLPFNVPMFFLISGYFLSARTDMKTFLKRKAQTLLVPYYVTSLIVILIRTLEGFILGGADGAKDEFFRWIYGALYASGYSSESPFFIQSIGAIWFLWATFWASLLLRLSLKLREDHRLVLIVALFIFGCASKKLIWLPLSIQPGCIALLYMYIGYAYRELQPTLGTIRKEYKDAVLLFSLAVYIFYIIDFTEFLIVHVKLGRGIIDIFGTLCACVVVFYIAKKIRPGSRIGKGLSYLGKYSIFILCIHLIELNIFPWWKIAEWLCGKGMPEFLTLPFVIVGKLTIDLTGAVILTKIKPVRRLFGMREQKI